MSSLAPTAAHAVKVQGLQAGTLRAGARTRQAHWVRGLDASSAPVEAAEDAEQLGWPREVTDLHHPASWVASHQRAGPDMRSGSVQSNLDVCSVQSEILPCARKWRRTRPGPCQTTPGWICARRGHSVARESTQHSSNHPRGAAGRRPTISK